MSFKEYLKEFYTEPKFTDDDVITSYKHAYDLIVNKIIRGKWPVREGTIEVAIGHVIGLDKNRILSIDDVAKLKDELMDRYRLPKISYQEYKPMLPNVKSLDGERKRFRT